MSAGELVASGALEVQPVDRVQAMSLFVRSAGGDRYYVPDAGLVLYVVDFTRGEWFCHLAGDLTLCSRGSCEHVAAVELYRAGQPQEGQLE